MVETFNCHGELVRTSVDPVLLWQPLCISVSYLFSVLKLFTRLEDMACTFYAWSSIKNVLLNLNPTVIANRNAVQSQSSSHSKTGRGPAEKLGHVKIIF